MESMMAVKGTGGSRSFSSPEQLPARRARCVSCPSIVSVFIVVSSSVVSARRTRPPAPP
jgi:hypothetical protein